MSFSLIGRMLVNRAGVAPKDPGYPLWHAKAGDLARARVGGVLRTAGACAAFIVAETEGSLVKEPPASATIDAYGKVDDAGFAIHRFYFGDNLLQVVTGQDGLIVAKEIKLFQKLAEIEPATPEEWDLWIKGADGNQPLLTGPTIKWQDDKEYSRVWSPGNGTAESKRHVESITVADVQTNITINAMLFGRQLSHGLNEWLQLAMCRQGSERWIEAYVGLTLEPGELSAI